MKVVQSTSDIEAWLATEFSNLGLGARTSDTNFFEVGGSSLIAIKLIARVDQVYGEYMLPPVDLFERPTIREIAATIHANCAKERAPA